MHQAAVSNALTRSDTAAGANSIYSIFERLNAGGTNLHAHEIRVALHNGPLVELIRDLNQTQSWRTLYGPANQRLKDHELILRFIAFYLESKKYERPLKSFLNTFLYNHKTCEDIDKAEVARVFVATCDTIDSSIGRRAFRLSSSINAALADAVMIGVARRLARAREAPSPAKLIKAFDKLLVDEDFRDAIARATADEERVRMRLDKATAAFATT